MALLGSALNGSAWLCLALLGPAWLCLALLGSAWLCLALLGSEWLCLALLGSAWLCLALLGLAGLCLAPALHSHWKNSCLIAWYSQRLQLESLLPAIYFQRITADNYRHYVAMAAIRLEGYAIAPTQFTLHLLLHSGGFSQLQVSCFALLWIAMLPWSVQEASEGFKCCFALPCCALFFLLSFSLLCSALLCSALLCALCSVLCAVLCRDVLCGAVLYCAVLC